MGYHCNKNKENKKNKKNKQSFTSWIKKHKYKFIIALLIGFIFAYFFNYKTNRSGFKLQELVLLAKGSCYHIHHWMFLLLFIGAILAGKFMHNDAIIAVVLGLFIGLSLEDLLFKDWYKIKNNCHKFKLIRFMKHIK